MGCVESMSNDTLSLVTRMRAELADVSERLRDAEVTDMVTGLMNRREMERQLAQRKEAGIEPVILVFELSGDVNDEIARQVAQRLASHFRHQDLICRWTEHEFLVIFQGTREMAHSRTQQIVPWIAGKYILDSGIPVEIAVDAGLVAPHLLAMQ
jgi:PleD family two-component response regulator